ncbi:MAG: hypothetical protein JNM70_09210 [Anaerolineae bacterium]|nr:hypothetical protein [Anaerolineae bacterium]
MSAMRISSLLDEITDFLAVAPTADEIIAFKPSPVLDQRLHDLLDKNSADLLSPYERAELDEFLRMNHFLTILKAKARLRAVEIA